MELDLNENVQFYKLFYGKYTEQMPLLLAGGRTPLCVAEIMRQRLISGKQDWKNNYFDTGDAFAYHPDGKFKVVLDAGPLRDLTSQSKLHQENGLLVLGEGVYEELPGEEFQYDDVKKILGKKISLNEVRSHPVWRALARGTEILGEYAPRMFVEMKEQFNYDKAMGVYISSFKNVPTLGAACIDWLEDRSGIEGGCHLDNRLGSLVGLALEA